MHDFLLRSQFCQKTEGVAISSRRRNGGKGREETPEKKVRDTEKKVKMEGR